MDEGPQKLGYRDYPLVERYVLLAGASPVENVPPDEGHRFYQLKSLAAASPPTSPGIGSVGTSATAVA